MAWIDGLDVGPGARLAVIVRSEILGDVHEELLKTVVYFPVEYPGRQLVVHHLLGSVEHFV